MTCQVLGSIPKRLDKSNGRASTRAILDGSKCCFPKLLFVPPYQCCIPSGKGKKAFFCARKLMAMPSNQIPVPRTQVTVAGRQMPEAGRQMPEARAQVTIAGSQIPVAGKQVTVAGSQIPRVRRQITATGSEIPAKRKGMFFKCCILAGYVFEFRSNL